MNQKIEKPGTTQDAETALPILPHLYQTLSRLIEEPQKFMNDVIKMNTEGNSTTLRTLHRTNPFLILTEKQNPLSPRDNHEESSGNPRGEPAPTNLLPGPLCMTFTPEVEDTKTAKTQVEEAATSQPR